MRPPFPPDLIPLLRPYRPPRGSGPDNARLALYLFLISATALFLAAILGYIILGLTEPPIAPQTPVPLDPAADPLRLPDRLPLHLPPALYISTAFLLLAGLAAELTRRAALARRRTPALRGSLALLALGLAFIAVQTPALLQLLASHRDSSAPTRHGLALVLILIHAVHVLGGIVPVILLTARLGLNLDLLRLRPASAAPTTSVAAAPSPSALALEESPHRSLDMLAVTAAYWHYLDAVWLVLLATFLLAG